MQNNQLTDQGQTQEQTQVLIVDNEQLSVDEEVTEEVNVLELAENAHDTHIQSVEVVARRFPLQLILTLIAIAVAVVALAFSIGKTDLKIGQGELFLEGGSVNKKLANLLQNDLVQRIQDDYDKFADINIREINILIELNNGDHYSAVGDIGDSDRVSAEIVFFPQESVEKFAKDCRAVLDVMGDSNVTYDEIIFLGKNTFTDIHAELSGRFSMGITAEEIMEITFYFGEIEVEYS